MRQILSLLVSLVLAATPLVVTRVLAASSSEEEVRKAVMNQVEALNRHDMEAFGNAYTPDADYVNVGGKWTKGRRAIQTNHEYLHGTIPVDTPGVDIPRKVDGIFKTSSIRVTQIEVRFLRKDVAVAHETWEMLGDAQNSRIRMGLVTFVLIREHGVWLIAAAQDTEINRP
jgi:hypothetical protein